MKLAAGHEWTESQIMRLPDVGEKYELVEGELVRFRNRKSNLSKEAKTLSTDYTDSHGFKGPRDE